MNEQRRLRLSIGAMLLRLAPLGERGVATGGLTSLDELAATVDLPLETARIYRKVAKWSGQTICQELDSLDVEVAYTVVRAAVTVPKTELGDREDVLRYRLETLVGLARAAQESGAEVVTETDLRQALGDEPVRTSVPRPGTVQEDQDYWEPSVTETPAPAGLSAEMARSTCATLLRDPAGRVEVFATMLANPEYLTELVSDGRARAVIQTEIKASAKAEVDPDDLAMDAAAAADPEVMLARWRVALQRRDHQAAGLLAYDPAEIVARGDEDLIEAVLKTVQQYSKWGERLLVEARRKEPRAD
ncbi:MULTISPECIES: hypothetical protein [unclassified Kitasatospora]|uniref:hypothetical protein n=1 Tax=unclassified Kitasatospora TaxID=2633591 RepID=UPI0012F8479D|nr:MULTISPECIES: hypothetical protein [unclassified Kitasatospora]